MFLNKTTWPVFLIALFLVSPTWAQDEVASTDESAAAEDVNETVNADATVNETQETSETTEGAQAAEGEEAAEAAEAAEGAEGAATEEEIEAQAEEMNKFHKGDLGLAGSPELENPNNSIFIGMGYYNIGGLLDGKHYAEVTPSLNFHFPFTESKKLTLRAEIPLRILALNRTSDGEAPGSIRAEDYDETGDYLKVIKQIRLGRKEDKLFVNVGRLNGVTVGHGTVMRRYNANLDPDRTRVGFQLDAYNDYGGFETFMADLALQSRVIGALGFIKPMALFSDNPIARSLSLGLHYTADLNAPKTLTTAENSLSVATDDYGYPLFSETQVGIIGADFEVKPIRLGNAFDLKVYGDLSLIANAGNGMTGGLLMRSNLGSLPYLHAFRVRMEGRTYSNNYLPQYFDGLYEIQKFSFDRGSQSGGQKTKYETVVEAENTGRHFSLYSEAFYALVDRLVVGGGIESLLDEGLYNLMLHLEVPASSVIQLYFTYYKNFYSDLAKSFARAEGESFSFESDTVLYANMRVMVLPILFMNAGLKQTYQWDENYGASGGYNPTMDFVINAQLGLEF
ncbi:MAG: hypothetical protein QGI45_09865 [Myxococcota bacterium]|jgi:hypothetical protein|nr:hypothetical protein [Myxococcota bacterium]